jgi:hypothetical protein
VAEAEENNTPAPVEPPTREQTIEQFAGLLFTDREIAIILDEDPAEFKARATSEGTPEYLAVNRGRLKNIAEVRASILQHAKAGSSPAQAQVIKLLEDLKLEND